jgi:hypothetical protein
VIDVRLNGSPVASAFLDEGNAGEGQWTVPLPQRTLRAGENLLEIGVEMTLPGADEADRCRLLDDKRLWTVIHGNSVLSVPYAIVDWRPDLSYMPYPFSQGSGLSHTLFVLPDQPNAAIAADLVQLAAQFGSVVKNDHLAVHAASAKSVEQETWQDHHLVLVGRPTQNALLIELNEGLPWPFVAGSDTPGPVPDEEIGLEIDPEQDSGLIQVASSPWNETRSILALTGTTDESVQLAIQALLEPEQELKGNLALVEPIPDKEGLIRVQTTDTRPSSPTEGPAPPGGDGPRGESSTTPTLSSEDKVLLAERWWK